MSDWEHHDRAWARFYTERGDPGHPAPRLPKDAINWTPENVLNAVKLCCLIAVATAALGCSYTVFVGEDLGVTIGRVLGIY